MATYVNDLRLKEIATGDESGTWGTSTNTNLELIGEAFSFGTEAITTNADTHVTTIADGSTDPGRSMFLKYTGTLDSACTITIGPNTVSKFWFIENATTGSQDIIVKQGSVTGITIPAGDTKAIYSDGAGSGAAMVDAFASLNVVDLKVQDDLTVTDDVTIGGTLDVTGAITSSAGATITVADNSDTLTLVSTDADANAGPVLKLRRNSSSPADDDLIGAIDFTSENSSGDEHDFLNLTARMRDVTAGSEDVSFAYTAFINGTGREIQSFVNTAASAASMVFNEDSQDIDFRVESNNNANMLLVDAGNDRIQIANLLLGEISSNVDIIQSTSSSGLLVDVTGDITLDADGGEVFFKDGGTSTGKIRMDDGDLQIRSLISDKDITLEGNDGGSIFEAMRLDMSAAGAATFNSSIDAGAGLRLSTDGSNNGVIQTLGQNKDLFFAGDDGGAGINALILDMSAAGAATFNSSVTAGTSIVIGDGEAYGFGDNSFRIEGKDDGTNARIGFVTGGSEAMRINSDQKILIGDSASHTTDLLQIETPASGGGHGIQIRREDSNSDQQVGHILFGNNTAIDLASLIAKTDGATDSGAMLFSTSATGGDLTERMRLTSTGKLGIGPNASSPNQYLSIIDTSGSNDVAIQFTADYSFTMGADTSDSGNFKISRLATNLGTNDAFVIARASGSARFNGNVLCSDIIATGDGGLSFQTDEGTKRIIIDDSTGQVQVSPGSASVPGLSFIGDTNTGINADNADNLGFTVGGTQRAFLSSTQFNVNANGVFAGSISKASGSFKIDHPLPAKTDTHHLVHSFVEAPQADNIYRGSVDLVGGSATVNIDTVAGMTDGTFVLLNTNVQCFTSNESGWTAIKGSVSGNTLTITAQDSDCTDTISWMVVGERHDQHMKDAEWTDSDGKVIVEPEKVSEGE